MAFGMVLNESNLRKMPSELRERLLKWYFEHSDASATRVSTDIVQREESGRVSFPKFVRAGLLPPGSVIMCKALKRQRRGGDNQYIEAGKVQADGYVDYRGQRYQIPSKLAVDAVNFNGGKTKALNGYDYLFVRTSDRLVPLQELRDRYLNKRHELA